MPRLTGNLSLVTNEGIQQDLDEDGKVLPEDIYLDGADSKYGVESGRKQIKMIKPPEEEMKSS